eukprot:Hpha_TRINITY_DN15585_c1_g7::TRINITY_DN15585_c1_g7_i3::g.103913::m.103913
MPELSKEQVLELQNQILAYMKANPEKVEKAKPMNHEERKKAIEGSEELMAKSKEARTKYGFDGEPEGAMRNACKPHMMDPDVVAVQKQIFEILAPADDSPDELKMYYKMVTGA